MKTTVEQIAWITEAGQALRFHQADPKDKYLYVYLSEPDLDMTSCGWVRVGTATIKYNLDETDELLQRSVEIVDAEIKKLSDNFMVKLTTLRDIRSNLLSLPSPE